MNKRPGLLVLSSLVATLAGQAAAVEVEQRSLSQDAAPARPAVTQPAPPVPAPVVKPVVAAVATPAPAVPRPVVAAPAAPAAPANPAWDMFQQIDALQATVARMQGQLEEQQQLVDRLKEDLKIRYTDLDQRLEQLSQQKPAAAAPSPVTDAASAAPAAAPAIPVPTPIVETPAAAPAAPVAAAEAPAQPATPAAAVAPAPTKPAATPIRQDISVEEIEKQKQAYLAAYQRFRSDGPAAAITAMTGFTQKFPDSVFSPNAHYWLGEFHLASEPANYAAAEASFKRVISDYDGSPKVASAYYKLGTIADLRGQRDEARRWMNELLGRFPSSPEARLAQSYLDQNPAGAAKPKG